MDDAEIAESRSSDQTETGMDAEQPPSVHQEAVVAHASNSMLAEVDGATEPSLIPPLGMQESVGPGGGGYVHVPVMASRVPQGSIKAHITINYGICAWHTDLEVQGSDREDGDRSRRRRNLRWTIVRRVVCLVSNVVSSHRGYGEN